MGELSVGDGWLPAPQPVHPSHTIPFFTPIFLFFLATSCGSCRILVPRPEIEPVPPAVEAQSPNGWTAREFPTLIFLVLFLPGEVGHSTAQGVIFDWPNHIDLLLLLGTCGHEMHCWLRSLLGAGGEVVLTLVK